MPYKFRLIDAESILLAFIKRCGIDRAQTAVAAERGCNSLKQRAPAGVCVAVEMRVHIDKTGRDRLAAERNDLRRLGRIRTDGICTRNSPVLYAQTSGQHGHFLRIDQESVLQ